MIEEFLGRVSESWEEYPDAESMRFEGSDLIVEFSVFINAESSHQTSDHEKWELRCSGVRGNKAYLKAYKEYNEFFRYYDRETDHPLKWNETLPKCSVSFYGSANSVSEVVGKLYLAHSQLTEGWIPFGEFFHMANELEKLISGGYGLLAEAPEPLALAYEKVMKDLGFKASVSNKQPPLYWNGDRYVEQPPLALLIMNKGYILAEKFEARKLSEKRKWKLF